MVAKSEKVVIVGAGLCGSLLGCYLVNRGFSVEIFEKRADLRKADAERGRSINLALSARGIRALDKAGIGRAVKNISIPMYGRAIHMPDRNVGIYPYSGRPGEYINSISRSQLNEVLLDKFEAIGGQHLHFRKSCSGVDFINKTVNFHDNVTDGMISVGYDYLFGTDGAASKVRQELFSIPYFSHSFQQEFLDYGYKELILPAGQNGDFLIEKNALHIWPRGHFMMIALPNLDGSFTVTLFLPLFGKDSFDEIDAGLGIAEYFKKYFGDLYPMFPDLEDQYLSNPIGKLGTIKCYPWTDGNSAFILGDAAHAIVPFYGQGMNAAFEDVRILDDKLELTGGIGPDFYKLLQESRKRNTDAIADLAIDNFYEMRDKTGDSVFQAKRGLETRLEKNFPEYYSKYSMVTFRDDLPYLDAMNQGRKQDEWLMKYCSNSPEIPDSELVNIHKLLTNYTK